MKCIGWLMIILGAFLMLFFSIVSFYFIITTITETYYGAINYNQIIKKFFIISISIVLDIISYIFLFFVGMILIDD